MDHTFDGPTPTLDPGERTARPRSAQLQAVRTVALLLDDAIAIPGTSWRIGLDPLLGLVPVLGDLLGALLSGWIVVIAARLGAPRQVLARMSLNVAIDTVVGAVPLAGDVFDAAWKSNRRNVRLLEAWLEEPARTRRSSGLVLAGVALLALAALAGLVAAVWWVAAWALAAR